MNAVEWEKVRKNWNDLCDVIPGHLLSYFYQMNVIESNEVEKIKAAETRPEQIERLLNVLKTKDGKQPYFHLLEALSLQNYHPLVQKIRETETTSDPRLKALADPSSYSPRVRDVLRENFTEELGASTKLQEIREVLIQRKAFPDGNEWKNDQLCSFLKVEFVSVETPTVNQMIRGKNRKFINVVNLRKINLDSLQKPHDQDLQLLPGPAAEKNIKVKLPIEHPRPFDQDITTTVKYKFGHCFTNIFTELRGSRISPIKNYHLIDSKNTDKALEQLGSDLILFASACMNERRNGTIYFGVSPVDHSNYTAGEIVGVCLDMKHVVEVVNNYLHKSFLDTQKVIIKKIIRDPKFVPLIKTEPISTTDLAVIEIDILPFHALMGKEIIKTKLELLPPFSQKTEKGVFRFSEDGKPKLLTEDEKDKFERELPSIMELRKEEEAKSKTEYKPNLREKLLGLLTGGSESLVDDVYPFLITSEIDSHMNEEYLLKNMPFIKYLQPEVVFDFDPNGYSNGIYKNLDSLQEESMRVLTTDDFDKQKNTTEKYDELVESISSKRVAHWVFCNGYEGIDPMDRREWNKCRRRAFQQALRVYIDHIGSERILIIFCLFSKSYETLLLACDEVLTLLPENWILLAESEDIVQSWQDRMLSEDKLDRSDLKNRCVIGMKWEQINNTIHLATDTGEGYKVLLPCSNGVLEVVPKKRLNEWSDVDVLTAGDMDVRSEDEINNKRNEVEQQFYRGEEVQWLNFWFGEQVLERDIHEPLQELVSKALNGTPDEDKVTYVELLHQPGAGGTTSAKNILWQFRKKYRCCHLKNITEHTCDQLDEIWQFKDSTPSPLLIFIDNLDEEECIKLKGKLEEKGRLNWRKSEESFDVFCTILECKRRASMPLLPKDHQKSLRHKLSPKEKEWFDRKNESLNELYEKDKKKINPRFLLAFNIMRENFKPNYVANVVREFSSAVKVDLEIELLKIVSFLNVYDPMFQPVKVSWLDHIFKIKQSAPFVLSTNGFRDLKWEAKLSEVVKFFLNLSNDRTLRKRSIQSVRIMNKRVAEEILKCMKDKTKIKESDIMLQLCKPDLYRQEGKDAGKYRYLINSVAKKRELGKDGKKLKFSRFVMHVEEHEGVEVVLNVLETLFAENKDAFTAQLISRVYLDKKNWQMAASFADRAVKIKPENSFLWDTAGRVVKAELSDIIDKNKQNGADGFRDSDIQEIINLADKGIEAFRKQQHVSEHEMTTMEVNNVAGYFGELRTIVLLLNALKSHTAFTIDQILHRFLVDERYTTPELQFLQKHAAFLKSLKGRSNEVMRRLDEEYLQMKSSHNQEEWGIVHGDYFSRESLIHLKANLDKYFEEGERFTGQLSESEECLYRLGRARQLGADSLNHLLRLRAQENYQKIQECYSIVLKNVRTKYCSFDDLRAILDAVTLLLVDRVNPPNLHFEDVISWSRQLFFMEQPKDIIHIYMEPYLYYVMYNFPTEERKNYVCSPSDLKKAVDTWYDMFKQNHPNHGLENFSLRRKVTTLFFLGNGHPLNDIVFQESLQGMETLSFKDKWKHPRLRQQLRLMEGILSNDGEKVNIPITTKEGNRFNLPIATSHQVGKSIMWNKKVYFYLGFSFKGPRAFGMSLEKLGESDMPLPGPSTNKRYSKQKVQQKKLLLEDLWRQKIETENNLLYYQTTFSSRKGQLEKIRECEKTLKQVLRDINSLLGE